MPKLGLELSSVWGGYVSSSLHNRGVTSSRRAGKESLQVPEGGPPPGAERWEAAEVGWDGKVEDQRPNGCTESWVIRRAGGAGHAAQGSSRPRGRNGKTSGQPQQPAYWAVQTAQGFETNQEGGSGSHLEALTR